MYFRFFKTHCAFFILIEALYRTGSKKICHIYLGLMSGYIEQLKKSWPKTINLILNSYSFSLWYSCLCERPESQQQTILSRSKPKKSPQKTNKLPVLTKSQDTPNSSDPYTQSYKKSISSIRSYNKLQWQEEDSRTSFESLAREFVKKISPQSKYDIQCELAELERMPHLASELFFETSTTDFGANDDALLFAEHSGRDR